MESPQIDQWMVMTVEKKNLRKLQVRHDCCVYIEIIMIIQCIVIYLFGENNRQVMYRQDTRQKYIHDIDSID